MSAPENFSLTEHGKMTERKNKGVIITAAVLAVIFTAALAASFFILRGNDGKKTAFIYQNGTLLYEIDLSAVTEIYTIKVENETGGFNVIEVRPNEIGIVEASCPDKVCMGMGFISSNALPVTCLPNKLIIRVEGKDEDAPDIVVY